MASSMRGQYPASFKGNIWSTNGTNYGWGSMFWGFNEEPMQHSYEGANHGELQDATLRMNLKNYESYKTLARQQWTGKDTEAIFIEETWPWNGPEKVPENISKDLLACTTPDGAGPMSPALTLFAQLRHYHDSRWQLPAGWTGLTTINGSEKAEHYWDRYLYTLDLKTLKVGHAWHSEPPADCPFQPTKSIAMFVFTGRHAEYTKADTWYTSWASDGNLYSPWTDGSVNGLGSNSAGKNATTGQAKIIGTIRST